MIVFKTFLKVLNQCKIPVIMYTVILVAFGAFNMQTGDSNGGFTASRPPRSSYYNTAANQG